MSKVIIPTYQDLQKSYSNTSERIRALSNLNVPRKEICMILNVRYQHVRNVQITPVNKK